MPPASSNNYRFASDFISWLLAVPSLLSIELSWSFYGLDSKSFYCSWSIVINEVGRIRRLKSVRLSKTVAWIKCGTKIARLDFRSNKIMRMVEKNLNLLINSNNNNNIKLCEMNLLVDLVVSWIALYVGLYYLRTMYTVQVYREKELTWCSAVTMTIHSKLTDGGHGLRWTKFYVIL